jgi:hypothetical protein
LKPPYRERELPGPGLIDLRLDLDWYARIFDVGAVEDLTYPVHYHLLQPYVGILGVALEFG